MSDTKALELKQAYHKYVAEQGVYMEFEMFVELRSVKHGSVDTTTK